jgi:hypothetical protein
MRCQEAADKRGPTCWHRNSELGKLLAQEPCRQPKIAKRWLGEVRDRDTAQESRTRTMRLCLEERSDQIYKVQKASAGKGSAISPAHAEKQKKAGNDGAVASQPANQGPVLVAWHRDRPRQKKSKSEWLVAGCVPLHDPTLQPRDFCVALLHVSHRQNLISGLNLDQILRLCFCIFSICFSRQHKSSEPRVIGPTSSGSVPDPPRTRNRRPNTVWPEKAIVHVYKGLPFGINKSAPLFPKPTLNHPMVSFRNSERRPDQR